MRPSLIQHPRGIATLFFTEMWERMSFYGLRALLILYMTHPLDENGMALDKEVATSIYGLYTCAVYLGALPGGWIADRLIGQQRAVLLGGIVIASGHFTLAIPDDRAFYLGLVLIVLGTSLLKPNVSAIVGPLYPEGGARRDAGYTLFYMGINLGAFLGPIICSALGEKWNWHYGFAAAGVGMVAGVIQYSLSRHYLESIGLKPPNPSPTPIRHWAMVCAALVGMLLVVILASTGRINLSPVRMAHYTTGVIASMAVLWFLWAFTLAKLDVTEKARMIVVLTLFLASSLFWSGFEQAGSSMNLFAEAHIDRRLGSWEMPTGWFQSANAMFILIFAPVVSLLWIVLERRGRSLSVITKMALGLILLGLGFGVMHLAADRSIGSGATTILVSPWWLIITYLLHTFGELFLSPVGLSAVSKLAPARLAGQMMGIWFLATALGNLIAGLLSGRIASGSVSGMPAQFLQLAAIICGTGVVLLAVAPLMRRLMAGVD